MAKGRGQRAKDRTDKEKERRQHWLGLEENIKRKREQRRKEKRNKDNDKLGRK